MGWCRCAPRPVTTFSSTEMAPSGHGSAIAAHHESVARYLVTVVPTAPPQQTAAAVRGALAGRRYDDASHVFVVADDGRLAGVARIEDILGAAASTPMSALMQAANCHVVTPDTDREDAGSAAIRAGASVLAVCDRDGRFIGAVPASALMSILRDEHLEACTTWPAFSASPKPRRRH